jgi:CHAD domain-containing protein
MSDFRIRPGKPVSHELARVVETQIRRARSRLERWSNEPERAFHEVRRRLKKVRSAARVARGVDEPAARTVNIFARDASRVLGRVRDADVVRATAARLSLTLEDDAAAAALDRFALQASRSAPAKSDRDALAAQADEILEGALTAVEQLRAATAQRKILHHGAKTALRRADAAFFAAHADAPGGSDVTEDVRHEWRKRVKDLWHVGRLLRDVWPLERRIDDALVNELGTILGEERDIFLLGRELHRGARACGGAAGRDAALASLDAELRRLYAAARRLGLKVHVAEPTPLRAAAARAEGAVGSRLSGKAPKIRRRRKA